MRGLTTDLSRVYDHGVYGGSTWLNLDELLRGGRKQESTRRIVMEYRCLSVRSCQEQGLFALLN